MGPLIKGYGFFRGARSEIMVGGARQLVLVGLRSSEGRGPGAAGKACLAEASLSWAGILRPWAPPTLGQLQRLSPASPLC